MKFAKGGIIEGEKPLPLDPGETIIPHGQALRIFGLDDIVRVVRCKDCIHYDFGGCLKIYSDGAVSQYAWQARNENDFCSYGERKDNGQT